MVEQATSSGESLSSTTFSAVRVVVREVDQLGPSGAAAIVLSSDASSEEDSNSFDTEASSNGDIW